jgi:peptidase E
MRSTSRILLISNSTVYGRGYLDHVEEEIKVFLGHARTVLFFDPDPASTHMGETQEERILQFLEENETPVVAIREGAWLLIENGAVTLRGQTGARIFRRGHAPVEAMPGTEISELVGAPDAI